MIAGENMAPDDNEEFNASQSLGTTRKERTATAADNVNCHLNEHEHRRQVVGEMHLRRWPAISPPSNILQWLWSGNVVCHDRQVALLSRLFGGLILDDDCGSKHLAGQISPSVRFSWERHREAVSLTLFVDDNVPDTEWSPCSSAELAEMVKAIEALPGKIIRATRIKIVTNDKIAEEVGAEAEFLDSDLVSCRVGNCARIWSDFRIKSDGYGRMLVAANGAAEGDLSRLVQRLQELGNYRNLALLGLPTAELYWNRLNLVEEKLAALGETQLNQSVEDEVLLGGVSALSFELMSIASASSYRMSATAAYSQLVHERISELNVSWVAGYPSLMDFTQRRFLPATRTCAAFSEREERLSLRVAQFAALLRAQIETRIEKQNAAALASMDRSIALQSRLQQLVEGFSVIALSYYVVCIIDKLAAGLVPIGIDYHTPLAILILPVIYVIWSTINRMKRKLIDYN